MLPLRIRIASSSNRIVVCPATIAFDTTPFACVDAPVNKIGDAGATALLPALTAMKQLTTLDLDCKCAIVNRVGMAKSTFQCAVHLEIRRINVAIR